MMRRERGVREAKEGGTAGAETRKRSYILQVSFLCHPAKSPNVRIELHWRGRGEGGRVWERTLMK